ncbi:MAG: S9 family peptidase, partial [Saprospiraceae bacterium]|nr:S9 family peptidase [Saprospiraceae bacterium]
LKGGEIKKLTKNKGWNSVRFSNTYDYFVNTYSTINSAPVYTVHDRNGKLLRTIEDNRHISILQNDYAVSDVEFFDFTTKDDIQLNGWMIKPPDFDANKEYPVFMYLYGGPGSQQVTNSWKGSNYWWFQMLAQKGYIVACVDNRGTGGRGEEFKKCTYLQLGHLETIDQIEAAKYLGGLPYADKDRIGIFGWSYGGYMSSLCLLKGNDVFKAAIAVAPVTSWKWYDTIYTERFMRTTKDNPEGYAENSPVNFADRLKGNYFLVHGMGDDNVHFQQSAEMSNALIEANKQFDTYYYPNQNHGIYGPGRRLHLYTAMTNFLDEKLKNDHTPVSSESKP